jgi:hypothetical protein
MGQIDERNFEICIGGTMRTAITWVTFFVIAGLLMGCGNVSAPLLDKSPSDVVKEFYAAANQGKYSECAKMLSEAKLNAINGTLDQMLGGLKGICDIASHDGTITKVDIVKVEVRGEGATVTGNIFYKDGSSWKKVQTVLIKEKRAWKITSVALIKF